MERLKKIPQPLNFNPLKHHLGFIRSFIVQSSVQGEDIIRKEVLPLLCHLGRSVADIYTGALSPEQVGGEMLAFVETQGLTDKDQFARWINNNNQGYRKHYLSDSSVWVVKYLEDRDRYVHFFPGRNREKTIRTRGNTLKTAILYDILFDHGDVLLSDLNHVRHMLRLSPLRDTADVPGIISLIRMLHQ